MHYHLALTTKMTQSVDAKDPNCELVSFFEIKDTDVQKINEWVNHEEITQESLREKLESAGKQAGLYVTISDYYKGILDELQVDIDKEEHDSYPAKRWSQVLQAEKDVTDLIGFLTLLQMDATTSLIGLLEAKNDTERIVLSKHAYTIIYEAEHKDLFKKVSREMHILPSVLLDSTVKHDLWRGIRSVVRMMVPINAAELVRNSIDAHKESFPNQMEAYRKCDYATSVVNLLALIKIVELLQKAMMIIIGNMELLIKQYEDEMTERIRKLDRLLSRLKEYEGKPLPPEGLTGDV